MNFAIPTLVLLMLAVGADAALAQQQGQSRRPQGNTQQQQPQQPQAATPSTGPLPVAVVAVFDWPSLLRESSAGKSIRAEIDRQRKTFQDEFSKREQGLASQQAELQRQQATLAPAAREEQERQFRTKVADYQREANARRQQLDAAQQNAVKEVEAATSEVLAQIASERGINVIVARAAVALSANELDITADVRGRVDRRLPRVAVKLPPLQN